MDIQVQAARGQNAAEGIERDPLSHRAGSHERQVSELLSSLFDCVKALGDMVDSLHDDERDD